MDEETLIELEMRLAEADEIADSLHLLGITLTEIFSPIDTFEAVHSETIERW